MRMRGRSRRGRPSFEGNTPRRAGRGCPERRLTAINRSHGALGNQSSHWVFGSPVYISATSPAALTEANLNGATLTLTLAGRTFVLASQPSGSEHELFVAIQDDEQSGTDYDADDGSDADDMPDACTGYELTRDLDFDTDGDGSTWTTRTQHPVLKFGGFDTALQFAI